MYSCSASRLLCCARVFKRPYIRRFPSVPLTRDYSELRAGTLKKNRRTCNSIRTLIPSPTTTRMVVRGHVPLWRNSGSIYVHVQLRTLVSKCSSTTYGTQNGMGGKEGSESGEGGRKEEEEEGEEELDRPRLREKHQKGSREGPRGFEEVVAEDIQSKLASQGDSIASEVDMEQFPSQTEVEPSNPSVPLKYSTPVGVRQYSLEELLTGIARAQDKDSWVRPRQRRVGSRRSTVMSIDEVVSFLREENAEYICVIRVPAEREYVDYFVVCGGMGTRHIRTMADSLASEVRRASVPDGVTSCLIIVTEFEKRALMLGIK